MNSLRVITLFLLTSLPLFFSAPIAAQSTEPVQIWAPAGEAPIRLRSLDVDAKVYGFMASTRLELEFYNPNNRVLEGEFVLPLTPNQRVVGYALEVDGKLREGVVVPKQTARIAFEEITRRGVDPGLAEITRGNVFRTRIYPIPAKGNKRISITIEQPLEKIGSSFRYVMPVPVKTKLERYQVRIEAVQSAQAKAGNEASLSLSDAKIAERTQQNVVPDSPLTLDLPVASTPAVYSVAQANGDFLQVLAQLQAPAPKAQLNQRVKTLAVYWDNSRSGKNRQHGKEIALLKAMLADKNIDTVLLTTFAIAAQPVRRFSRQMDDFSAFFAAMQAIDYDGGTQLTTLKFNEAADLALIFTDADSTFEPYQNESAVAPKLGAARSIIAHAALSPNARGLAALAHRLNAVRLDLTRTELPQALALAAAPPLQAIASAAAGLCLDAPSVGAVDSGSAYLVARCRVGTVITINWQQSGAVVDKIRVPSPFSSDARIAAPIARAWAFETIQAMQLQSLGGQDSARSVKSQTLALALDYALVTEQTSLLVLDSIEDYVRYDIAPPEPELRAQFDAMRTINIADASSEKSDRLSNLKQQWSEFKRYHQMRYDWIGGSLLPFAQALNARVTDPKAKKQLADMLKRTEALANLGPQNSKQLELNRRKSLDLLKALQSADADWLASLSNEERNSELKKRATASANQRADSESGAQLAYSSAPADMPAPSAAPVAAAAAPQGEIGGGEETLDRISVTGSRIQMALESKEIAETNDSKPSTNQTQATVAIKPYTANAPYLSRMRAAKDPYAVYLIEAASDGSVGFYLDCAEFFYSEHKLPQLGLLVLSNITETQIEDISALRALAEQLRQWHFWSYSLANFQQVMQLRTEEPQGARDFALALAVAPANAGGDRLKALTLLWHVANHDWDDRFSSISLTALHEFNDVYAATPVKNRPNLQALGVPEALVSPLSVGLRVVLGWNANDVDIDLWVRDPLGEWAFYSQRQTGSGGQMSDDFTQGYGPETFTIARPIPGKYTVFAHYYGNHQQKLSVPISVYLSFQTPFGLGTTKSTSVVRRLDTNKEDQEIGEFTVLE